MKVKVLKQNIAIKGIAGEEVECEPAIGNALAGRGIVRVLEHEPAPAPEPAPPTKDSRPKAIRLAEKQPAAKKPTPKKSANEKRGSGTI